VGPAGAKVADGIIAIRVSSKVESMRLKSGLMLLGVAAIAGGAVWLARFRHEDTPTVRQVSVGAVTFTLLSGYLRPSSRGGGRLDTLDLAAFFPDFTPAGDTADINGATDLVERYEKLVFITIKPSDSSLDPVERPTKLYARFLETDEWTHPGGLTARAFQSGSPFEGQELYFVAPEGRAFAARCGRPDSSRKTPNACVYDFREDGLDVELRFSAAILSQWEKLNEGARGLIEAARH
jgi:hypothetical protein